MSCSMIRNHSSHALITAASLLEVNSESMGHALISSTTTMPGKLLFKCILTLTYEPCSQSSIPLFIFKYSFSLCFSTNDLLCDLS